MARGAVEDEGSLGDLDGRGCKLVYVQRLGVVRHMMGGIGGLCDSHTLMGELYIIGIRRSYV